MRLFIALISVVLLAGCSSYSFQITKPDKLATLITETQVRVQTANLTYRMQAKENRLVLLAFNDTEQAIQLLGERSFVVDPRGASHPLRSQAIAPHSYAKLILPPLLPRFERNPSFQFGIGTAVSRRGNDEATPVRRMALYEEADAYYWDWDGASPIRLSIAYQRSDGTTFTDEFTIVKVKEQ